MEIKILSVILKLLISINISMSFVQAVPIENSQQTEVNEEVIVTATPYPDIQRRFVDLSYVSPEVSDLIQRSNLNPQQIREQQERLKNKHAIESEKNRYDIFSSQSANQFVTSSIHPPTSKEQMESMRLSAIQSALEATLRHKDAQDIETNSQQERPEFDFSFAPICEMPRHMNISEWFQTKSWNVLFQPLYQQFNVKSVMLRLYKVSLDGSRSESEECDNDTAQMMTLTISVYIRKRREFKKKVIFQTMIDRSYSGWIEIDARGTLKYWDLQKNNHGMAIDVYDQEEKQLDAREFFHLQDCEAGSILPWRAFQFIAKQSSEGGSVSSSIVQQLQQLYTGPRLDITSTSPPNYQTNSEDDQQQQQQQQQRTTQQRRQQRHVRHENHHFSRHNSAVTLLRNNVHEQRSDHLHRDNSKVIEET